MPLPFIVAVRFLSGRCVAGRYDDRRSTEWPVDPARLFMAAVDTLHALGNQPAHREALRWLEAQPAPEIRFETGDIRNLTTHYVPVNDVAAHPGAGVLTTVEGLIQRKRQPRTFPCVILGEPTLETGCHLAYCWNHTPPRDDIREALFALLTGISHLGQSTSPVCIQITDNIPELENTVVPRDKDAHRNIRVPGPGFLDALEHTYTRVEKDRATSPDVESTMARTIKKGAKRGVKKPSEAEAPERDRPSGWLTQTYGTPRDSSHADNRPVHSKFSADFTVLSLDEGRNCGLPDTLGLTDLLRSTTIKTVPNPIPRWLSGHENDGTPSKSSEPHTAFIALPFAGWPHADGSVKGLAIVRPRVLPSGSDAILSPLFYDENGEEREIRLVAGNAGEWTIRRETRTKPPRTLSRETWTAAPFGAIEWASVTPFAFDRMPKSKIFRNDGGDWDAEVARIIGTACERIGLPRPESVRVSESPLLTGVPRSEDFPPLPSRPGMPTRLLRHIAVRFSSPVVGPVILGAGRFKGYGLMKPQCGLFE